MMYGKTSPNRTVYASLPSVDRATKNRSRPTAFVRFFSATFWPAAMLCIAAGQNVVNSRNVMRSFADIESIDTEGINLMLDDATVEEYLTEEEFILNIIKKGIADEIINKNDYLEYF
jgi:hypothetical protein